ncbi:MAG: hypothetical protein M3P08_05725 [Thermoproteota archaeon]|nr:hypothetical protein [Thermoproteota archaeon]
MTPGHLADCMLGRVRQIFSKIGSVKQAITERRTGGDGKDGDRVVVSGSHDLMCQFMTFIENNIPNARTRLITDRKIYRLILYSYTARKIIYLLYENCVIALDRKLEQARRMIDGSTD